MNDNQGTKNDFIREQIKEKPLNKKKYMARVGMSALSGAVFALSASVVFAVVMPYLSVEGKSKETVLDTEQLMVSEKETEEVTENKETQNTESGQMQGKPVEQRWNCRWSIIKRSIINCILLVMWRIVPSLRSPV